MIANSGTFDNIIDLYEDAQVFEYDKVVESGEDIYYFYHNLFRKYITMTESFFQDIVIYKDDKEIKVPIAYSDKNKFIQRYLKRDISLKGVKTTVPRMSYTFTNIYYDPERKLNRLYKFTSIGGKIYNPAGYPILKEDLNFIRATADTITTQFTPVPYNIDIEVSTLTNKNMDAWQIIEQILPKFTPDIKFTSNLIAGNEIKLDLSLNLNSVYINDNIHTTLSEERRVEYGLNLTLKGYFFREIIERPLITDIKCNVYDFDASDIPLDTLEVTESDL